MNESATMLERRLAPPAALDPARTALFLDLDGTLAHIAALPHEVGPHPRRTKLLRALSARLAGRLAVVSGRSLDDLDRILEEAVTAAAGVHGLVRRNAAGSPLSLAPHPAMEFARRQLETFARERGLLLEDKGLALALHFRSAPEHEAEGVAACRAIAGTSGLVLQLGQMVAELRTPGADKGASVRAFMTEPPFAGARPVFVGDDLTDEDGFAAVAELGGFGVLVGPERGTAAKFRLPDVDAVLNWLEAVAEGRPWPG